MHIQLHDVSKRYNQNWIFKNVDLKIQAGEKLAILGINGSGKSTLLQVLSGHVLPTVGDVTYTKNNVAIPNQSWYKYIGYTGPVIELVQEFSIKEFLNYHFKFKKPLQKVEELLDYVGLTQASNTLLTNCSSGMLQRIKLLQAMAIEKEILFLDEPTSNLDEAGIALYHQMLQDFAKDCTVIISSNDAQEYAMCERVVNINEYK
jgi:ABC-type multidrug transport system ATPase subunit